MFGCTSLKEWKPNFDYFIDTKKLRSTIPHADYDDLISQVTKYNPEAHTRHAHLVRNYTEFAMAKIWMGLAAKHRVNYKPFLTIESVAKWLHKSIDELSEFLSSGFLFEYN